MDKKSRNESEADAEVCKAMAIKEIITSRSFILISVDPGKGTGITINGKIVGDIALSLLLHSLAGNEQFKEKLKEVIELLNEALTTDSEAKQDPAFKMISHLMKQHAKKDSN